MTEAMQQNTLEDIFPINQELEGVDPKNVDFPHTTAAIPENAQTGFPNMLQGLDLKNRGLDFNDINNADFESFVSFDDLGNYSNAQLYEYRGHLSYLLSGFGSLIANQQETISSYQKQLNIQGDNITQDSKILFQNNITKAQNNISEIQKNISLIQQQDITTVNTMIMNTKSDLVDERSQKDFSKKYNIPMMVITSQLHVEEDVSYISKYQAKSNTSDADINARYIELDTPYYFEKKESGEILPGYMTGLVLDFSGSMEKSQIEGIILTLRELDNKGIIDANTQINIVHGVRNGDDYDDFRKNTIDVSYGQDGEGLRVYLKSKGILAGDSWEVANIKGTGCTPLYNTILNNLQNPLVKDVNVFTDGASDVSSTLAFGDEEFGNIYMWDSMIKLCKEHGKKINIIAFNLDPKYMERAESMKDYFESVGALEYLNFVSLGNGTNQNLGGEDLANELTRYIYSRGEVIIESDPNIGQVRLYNTNRNSEDAQNEEKNRENNSEYNLSTNIDLPKTDGTVYYEGIGDKYLYNFSLGELFPEVDLSHYNISYTNVYAEGFEKIPDYRFEIPPGNTDKIAMFFDISGSMNSVKKSWHDTILKDNSIGFDQLLDLLAIESYGFQSSLFGGTKFNKVSDGKVEGTFSDKLIDSKNITKDLDMNAVDRNIFGSILIKKLSDLNASLDPDVDKTKKEMYEKGILSLSSASGNALKIEIDKIYTSSGFSVEDRQSILQVYTYIKETTENLPNKGKTPLLDALAKFGLSGSSFLEQYRGSNILFVTDLGENASDGWMKNCFDNIKKGKPIDKKDQNNLDQFVKNIEEYDLKFTFKVPVDNVLKANSEILRYNDYQKFVETINELLPEGNKIQLNAFDKNSSPLYVSNYNYDKIPSRPLYTEIKLTPKNGAPSGTQPISKKFSLKEKEN